MGRARFRKKRGPSLPGLNDAIAAAGPNLARPAEEARPAGLDKDQDFSYSLIEMISQ